MIETAPLERATEAYGRMMKNEARFHLDCCKPNSGAISPLTLRRAISRTAARFLTDERRRYGQFRGERNSADVCTTSRFRRKGQQIQDASGTRVRSSIHLRASYSASSRDSVIPIAAP